jgi:hypothetical protein
MSEAALGKQSLFLVRILLLRALGFVHGVAFLVALRQNKALIGDNGIAPARHVLEKAQEQGKRTRARRQKWREQDLTKPFYQPLVTASGKSASLSLLLKRAFARAIRPLQRMVGSSLDNLRYLWWDRADARGRPVTTLLWIANDQSTLNPWLDTIALTGLCLSILVLILGAANVPIIFGMWLCQRSLMAVGGPFYGFGWEPQLAELSFHTLWLVPWLSLRKLPNVPISPLVAFAFRWMLFRIMMGAGLIKLRSGDKKWKNATAMNYFYETQPVPNPLSRYFHRLPSSWHKLEVYMNHFVELIAPWLLIAPGLPVNWRRAGGLIQMALQAVLITCGNLSFLNWLTMVPALMCLDDELVAPLFSAEMRTLAMGAVWTFRMSKARQIANFAFITLIAILSVPVVKNLLSKNQIMNSSFDPLRLVNSYGAFGTVGEVREEWIVSSAATLEGPWKEYEFPVKPGDIKRSPRWISPYHFRLDWQLWIAATCRTMDRSPWMFNFMLQLLRQDERVMKLLAKDPWKDSLDKPLYIRVDSYRYKYHRAIKGEKGSFYWDRELIRRVYPKQGVATISTLQDEVLSHKKGKA